MSCFGLVVEFTVRPEGIERFIALITENARCSVTDEPRCRRFDVLQDAATKTRFVLYELYDDAAAFEAHKKAPHFDKFFAEARSLIVSQRADVLTMLAANGS